MTLPSSTTTPSTISGTRADEAVVLDDGGRGLQGLEHAADADAARKMRVLADLRAGADGCPSVNHHALVDERADVGERGHQHHVGRHEGALAHDRARRRAQLGAGERSPVPARELRVDLVVEAVDAVAHGGVVADAEGQQRRLLQPFVDDPAAVILLGDALAAGVQVEDGGLNRRLQFHGGGGGIDFRSLLESVVDDVLDGPVCS